MADISESPSINKRAFSLPIYAGITMMHNRPVVVMLRGRNRLQFVATVVCVTLGHMSLQRHTNASQLVSKSANASQQTQVSETPSSPDEVLYMSCIILLKSKYINTAKVTCFPARPVTEAQP